MDQQNRDVILGATRRIRNALNTIDHMATETDPPPPDSPPANPTEPEAYLIVGKAEGKPGETVTVEILGSTPVPVRGFSMGIGCNPDELDLTHAEITPEFAGLVGLQPIDLTLVATQGGGGGIRDHLSIMAGFFKPHPSGANLDAIIPPMTPMVRLGLEIVGPAPVEGGKRVDLVNRGAYYGRKFKGPDGDEIRLLIDNHYVATPRKYLKATLQSGWVDVS